MKIRTLLAGMLVGLSGLAFCATPRIPIDCNIELSDSQYTIVTKALNTPTIRATIMQGTSTFSAVGYNAYLSWGKDAYATNMVVVTGSVSEAYVDFNVQTNDLAYPIKRWYCSVMLTKPADGSVYSISYGYMTVLPSPEVNSTAILHRQFAINGSDYGPFTGSFTNWPFALVADYSGYVLIGTFNTATNFLYSQITSNLANQGNTNVIFEDRIASSEASATAQGNTNVIYEDRITLNETFNTAQGNTNSLFQGLFDALTSTNSLFQGFFTAQTSTNSLFQSLFDALTSTNSLFQGLFNAQVNTNSDVVTALAGKSATNHTHSQYLTSGTNRFDEIFIAPLSDLSTNKCSLTDGTYTGVVAAAGIAFTGTVDAVRGRTYLFGFTKANAFGTSVLAFAGGTLTATVAGVKSNLVTAWNTTDTNIILSLYGDGSSKSDVSGVFVYAFTNGDASVAGRLAVAGDVLLGQTNSIYFPDDEEISSAKVVTWDAGAIAAALWAAVSNQVQTDILANAGNITTNAANITTKVATNDAAYLAALTNGALTESTSNAFWTSGRMIGIAIRTNYEAIGSAAAVAVNLTDASNRVVTIEGKTSGWDQASADGSAYTSSVAATITSDMTNDWNTAWSWGDWSTNDLNWGALTGTPDTAAGYGMTDVYTKAESDGNYAPIAHDQDWSTITNHPDVDQAITDAANATTDVAKLETDFTAHTNNESADIQHLTAAEKLLGTNSVQIADFASHTNNESADIQHLTAAEKLLATNSVQPSETYQEFTGTVTPDDGGTCTVAYANGSLVKIDVSTNITIYFDNAAYPTNGVNRVGLEVWAPTNTVAFVDGNVSNVSDLTFTDKEPASLFFRKTGTNTVWWGRD